MKKINYIRYWQCQRGYSLIEVLISVALGLFLMTMLIRLALWQETIYHELTDCLYLQENGRLGTMLLGNEIRTAGYFGCRRHKENRLNDSLQIYGPDAQANNEIEIKKMATYPSSLKKGDQVVVSDCEEAMIGIYDPMKKALYAGKAVGHYVDERFFVADTHRNRQQGQPLFALYQKVNHSPRVEVVEGVKQLKAKPIKNKKGEIIAVMLWLKMYAPYGASQSMKTTFACRERLFS